MAYETRCGKASITLSKADRKSRHHSEMAQRKIDRWYRKATHRMRRDFVGKSTNPAYRKGIWPEGKVAKPGRMG